MSAGRAKAVWLWFHFILLLLRAGTTDETSGGLHIAESAIPLYAEVGPDYAYASIKFSGDIDLLLPPSGQWGDIGKKQETLKWIKCFYVF